jgi:HD-like signal output (HDOD) protein
MLETSIRKKLESLTQLPTIPFVISEVLHAVDNVDLSAAALASIIQRDQTLTARVLAAANSPFYGFARRISTIDLAVVVIGLNAIKEIVLSYVIQKFIARIRTDIFDINSFWHYSIFSGAASRYLARKLGYRVAGEAFVAGLMHDIGILVIVQYFPRQFNEIRKLQYMRRFSFVASEKVILHCTHCDVGAWFAEKWNLPSQLCQAIMNHHTPESELIDEPVIMEETSQKYGNRREPRQPEKPDHTLTSVVALTERFAEEMGFKKWAMEKISSPLYIPQEIIDRIQMHDVLNTESVIEVMKQDILEEYQKAVYMAEGRVVAERY